MDSDTFKSRQQYLKEFYSKDRVDFLSALKSKEILNYNRNRMPSINERYYRNEMIFFYIDTEATFKKSYINSHIPFENYHKFLKPFIYFLCSFTNREKFLKDSILYLNDLRISYIVCNSPNESEFSAKMSFPFLHGIYEGFNFLNKLTISDFTKGINEIHINLSMCYMDINEVQFIRLGGIIEELEAREAQEEEREEENIINSSQCFKSDECVICLTNPPNVLFCNCGHICFCLECEKLKNSNRCPICKIENKIIRYLINKKK